MTRWEDTDDELDGDEGSSVGGAILHPRQGLPVWARGIRGAKPPPPAPFGFNEVRWGAQVDRTVTVTGLGTFNSGPQEQIMQITEPRSRIWSLDLALEWVNFQEGVGAETLSALFAVRTGVGSSQVSRLANVTANTTVSIGLVNLPVVPAATIYVSVQLQLTALGAPFPRTLLGRVTAQAAPYFRGGDT